MTTQEKARHQLEAKRYLRVGSLAAAASAFVTAWAIQTGRPVPSGVAVLLGFLSVYAFLKSAEHRILAHL